MRNAWPAVLAALFVTGCPEPGSPPDAPSRPEGVEQGYPNHPYVYTVTTTDPDGDSVSFQFDWGDGPTAGWTRYVASGGVGTDTHSWAASGSYTVRCRARQSEEILSDWSEGLAVVIVGDGDMVWEFELGARAVGSPARLRDGVLCGTEAGDLVCVDSTGGLVWRWQGGAGARLSGAPVVAGDSLLFVATTGDRMRCLDATGDTVWDMLVGYQCTPPAVGPDGLLYFGAANGKLYACGQDGRIRWSTQHQGAIRGPVVVTADTVVVFGTDDGTVVGVGPDQVVRWTYATGGRVRLTPALDDGGNVYVGSEDDTLHVVRAGGQIGWKYGTRSNIRSSAAVGADGRV
ncbi:MAG: PQQ-binding-like beta-propeller repeat protein [candidate division WOR-3 bacterium]|nr:MAG: PQQ-binding-like beta-propeller repeat protein [candidate division WOR-3 bacterium]